jgi:uncharacterized caspase-like protein
MKTALLLVLICFSIARLHAANRVALVIGNNHYANLPDSRQLTSPAADAEDVAAALKALGYTVISGGAVTNAGKDTIISATEKFATAAKGADAAVFYYSGHGVQVGEDNYLLPSDAPRLTGISVLKNRAVLLRDSVMVALEEANVKTKVIILDCCRDNPFSAQLEAALAQVGKSIKTKSVGEISGYGPGFYLAFATSPGFTADDGNGKRNSPFTAAMLKTLITSASEDIDFFFREVKLVLAGTDQVSWTNHSLTAKFALAAAASAPSQGSPPAAPPALTPAPMPLAVGARGQTLPADLPEAGYFPLHELYAGGPYDRYNRYTKTEILKKVQKKLLMAGHYTGAIDGRPGPATQKGLLQWQKGEAMNLSGRLDQASIEALELSGLAESAPPPVPVVVPRAVPFNRVGGSFGASDMDKDGRLTREEYDAGVSRGRLRSNASFSAMDLNSDGSLSEREFR